MFSKTLKNPLFLLFLIFLLAAGLRIIRQCEESFKSPDTYTYAQMALAWKNFGIEKAFETERRRDPPAFVWVMTTGSRLGFDPIMTAVVVGIILGSFVPVFGFFIGSYLFDNKHYALITALMLAIHPFMIRDSVSALRESIFYPIIALALLLAIKAIKETSSWEWLFVALLVACSILVRKEGAIWFVFILMWLAIEPFLDIEKIRYSLRRNFIIIGIMLIIVIAIVETVVYMIPQTSTWEPFFIWKGSTVI